MKKQIVSLILMGVLFVIAGLHTGLAQSNVDIFFVACADKVVMNLSGQMQSGFDVFYQVFSGPDATGSALTPLMRVEVNGAFAVGESRPYAAGEGGTVAVGAVLSARVSIARESDPSRSIFTTTLNDLQDGCAEPQNPPVTSIEVGDGASEAAGGAPTAGSGVLSPFGGEVNPGIVAEPLVKIGARQSQARSQTPGLIFAECDEVPLAHPGILYDTDELIVFWSWFAKTPALLQDHIDHAQYSVRLNGEPFPVVERTEIQRRGANYWVFYIVRLGQFWRPGKYGIAYKLTWDQVISDGYEDFGPGTQHEIEGSTCTFEIQPNPSGIHVTYAAPPIPH